MMTKAEQEKVARLARVAARRYKRRCWWADVKDLEQEAWVAAMLAKRSWKSDRGTPFEAYAWVAMVRWMRGYLLRNSSPASVPWGALEAAKGLRSAGEVKESTPDPDPSPEASVVEAYWRRAVRRAFRDVAVEVDAAGLAEALLDDEKFRSSAYAERVGARVEGVYREKEKLMGAARGDRKLRRVLREGGAP